MAKRKVIVKTKKVAIKVKDKPSASKPKVQKKKTKIEKVVDPVINDINAFFLDLDSLSKSEIPVMGTALVVKHNDEEVAITVNNGSVSFDHYTIKNKKNLHRKQTFSIWRFIKFIKENTTEQKE